MDEQEGAEASRRRRVLNLARTMSRARAEAIVYNGAELTGAEQSAIGMQRYAAARSANLDGAEAARSMSGNRMDGRAARAHLGLLEQLDERTADLDAIDDDIRLHDIYMRRRTEFRPEWR